MGSGLYLHNTMCFYNLNETCAPFPQFGITYPCCNTYPLPFVKISAIHIIIQDITNNF